MSAKTAIANRQVTVHPELLSEEVGVDLGTQAHDEMHASVSCTLASYPIGKQLLDGHPSLQLRQIEKLHAAVRSLVEADAALDEGARLRLEGLTTDSDGMPIPEYVLDIPAFADKLTPIIEHAESDLQLALHFGLGKGRRTESARNSILVDLAQEFQRHYRLPPQDYRAHLADFLRGLLISNGIPCPGDADRDEKRANETLLDLLPQALRRPSGPSRI